MPDAREYASVLADAEGAAKQGDYVRAEALLREALALQESALGATHPEVASTLNNLAVVCDSTGRIDEAERLYRRAYDVARAAAGRPGAEAIVATSLENLRDFCAEHGRPFNEDVWPVARPASTASSAPAPVRQTPANPAPAETRPGAAASAPGRVSTAPTGRAAPAVPVPSRVPPPRPPASAAPARGPQNRPVPVRPRLGLAVALSLAGLAVTAGVGWLWLRPVASPPPEAAVAEPVPTAVPATPAPEPPPVESQAAALQSGAAVPPSAPPTAADTTPPAAQTAAPTSTATPPAAQSAGPDVSMPAGGVAGSQGATRVTNAELCTALDRRAAAWRCTPLEQPAGAGRVTFVARVATGAETRVQHQWLQDGQLRQAQGFTVPASPGDGYRTFSGLRVSPGAWTVTVTDETNAVLYEARFDVR